jgi:hypothetical protein
VTAQLSLFDIGRLAEPDYQDCQTIEERFQAFHDRNPQVYRALRDMALEMRRRGHRQYGIKALFEVLRFNHAMRTEGDIFKLNNNYTALYARLLMDNEPELDGFFELRRRTADPAHVV